MKRFNHSLAVAAAQGKVSELWLRAMKLSLAQLVTIPDGGDGDIALQRLNIRRRCLEHFIDDPYRADSLLCIGFQKDCRLVLEAGAPRDAGALSAPNPIQGLAFGLFASLP